MKAPHALVERRVGRLASWRTRHRPRAWRVPASSAVPVAKIPTEKIPERQPRPCRRPSRAANRRCCQQRRRTAQQHQRKGW